MNSSKKKIILILAFSLIGTACENKSSGPATPGGDFVSLPIFLKQWGGTGSGDGQFGQLGGLTLDASGNLYACDTVNNRVEKFDSDGHFLLKWGTSGSATGQFHAPAGIASLENKVYVVDSGNSRVQVFDVTGNHLSDWGSAGSGDSQFDDPQGIAVNAVGEIYVVDGGNDRVQKFTA